MLEAIKVDGQQLLDDTYAQIHRCEDDERVVHRVFRLQDPRQVLIDLSHDASMVVVGSRGRGPVRSLLLGSISVMVSQYARCPVVVLRAPDDETENSRIVVGVTINRPSSNAVDFVYRQASLRSLRLAIVRGLWDPLLEYTGPTPVAADEKAFELEAAVLAERGAELKDKFPDVEVTYELAKGLPDDCLVRATRCGVANGDCVVCLGPLDRNRWGPVGCRRHGSSNARVDPRRADQVGRFRRRRRLKRCSCAQSSANPSCTAASAT
ncbi:MAG: universal stress protein [Marmoricola sp.]